MCFSCFCLFILHTLIFVLILFLLMSGLAAAYDCDTLWTFLIVVFKLHCYLKCDTFIVAHYPYNSSNVCITIDCYTVLLKVSRQITKH